MRVVLLLVLFALVGANQVYAQADEPLRRPALGTYDVIALRVEFQPDTTRFTTGDGTFEGDLFQGLSPTIDPLPHDSAYFAAHLAFLEGYVQRVSGGLASVRTHVLPGIVRVSQRMGAYTPTGENSNEPEELVKLARLIEEAWSLAENQISFSTAGFDPARTAFVIFHAGVGRDVELTNTTLDRTPEDLPSLFFGSETLGRLLPDMNVSFNGLRVDHSLILPRTESRRGVDFITDEPFLVEISTNGMLAASFFNYLGVPDLFDTESGQSAIGPFGLMDPLGIFAYAGLFAPAPSAWTRYYLGWVEPIEVMGPDSTRITLYSTTSTRNGDVARVWISESEYFLVENRQRDVDGDGVRITSVKDGVIEEYVFQNGTQGFISQDVSAFPGGVVVAVDDYDWAMPGGLDEEGVVRNGGILIWHVDEQTIRQTLSENRVNANPGRRGVDLEEADSAEDLGFPSENPFAPAADLGSPFDYWFEGNPVRVVNQVGQEIALYQNRFGPDTYPNSNTASGGLSFVELADFSPSGNEMAFTYRRVSDPSRTPIDLPFADALQDAVVAGGVPATASMWDQSGHFVVSAEYEPGDWLVSVGGPAGTVATFETLSPASLFDDRLVWVEQEGENLIFVQFDPKSGTTDRTTIPRSAGARVVGAVVSSGESASILAEVDGSATVLVLSDGAVSEVDVSIIGSPIGLVGIDSESTGRMTVAYGRSGAIVPGTDEYWVYSIGADERVGRPVGGVDQGGYLGVVPLPDRETLLLLGPDGTHDEIPVRTPGLAQVALAEVTGDENLEVLVAGDSLMYAFERSGAVAAGFPVRLRGRAAEAPVVAVSGDVPLVLVPLTSGIVDAYLRDAGGQFRRANGFSMSIGAEPASIMLEEGTDAGTTRVFALSRSGRVHGWTQPLTGSLWAGPFGDATHSSFASVQLRDEPPSATRLLVSGETYNWPNPIRDGRTFIRCVASEDSRIEITIIDGAGGLVDELTMESVKAGIPSEIAWETNASSGLYFARVRAVSTSGREDTRVVKMAVIR